MINLAPWGVVDKSIPASGEFTYNRVELFEPAYRQADAAIKCIVKACKTRGYYGASRDEVQDLLLCVAVGFDYDDPIPSGSWHLEINLSRSSWRLTFVPEDNPQLSLIVRRRVAPFPPEPEYATIESAGIDKPDIGLSDFDAILMFQHLVVRMCRTYGYELPGDEFVIVEVKPL